MMMKSAKKEDYDDFNGKEEADEVKTYMLMDIPRTIA